MDDDEIEAWWEQREEEGTRPKLRGVVHRHHRKHEDDYYACGRCGDVLHVTQSTCPNCGTCYGC